MAMLVLGRVPSLKKEPFLLPWKIAQKVILSLCQPFLMGLAPVCFRELQICFSYFHPLENGGRFDPMSRKAQKCFKLAIKPIPPK